MTQPAPSAPTAPAPSVPQNQSPAAGGAPQPGGAAPPAPSGWLEGVAPDLATYATEQGMNGVTDLLAGHRGLMRLKGVPERELLRLPEKWEDNPDESARVYARMGRPEKAEAYELPEIPVSEGGYDLTPGFRTKAFELGVSGRAAKGLAEWFVGEGKAAVEARESALAQRDQQEEIALKAEWGGAYEENITAGKRAWAQVSQTVGLDAKDIDHMQRELGYSKLMKLFASLGRTIGEDTVRGGEPEAAFGMTPAAATAKADQLLAEASKLEKYDPRRQKLLDESLKLRHQGTGEQPNDLTARRG